MSDQKARISKCQTWGIVSLIAGGVLAITSIFIPMLFENAIISGAQNGAFLTQANQDKWDAIPGENNIQVFWNHYLFSCSNIWNVVFNNAAPTFTQYGTFQYQEYDTYTDLEWTSRNNNATNIYENVVLANFNQNTAFYADNSGGFIDTPMWFVNQGGIGAWWGSNNADPWKTYMPLLYNLVNVGLGQGVQDTWTFIAMQSNYFATAADIGTNLMPTSTPSQAVLDVMFSDPYYGLQDPNNYARWNVLQVVAKTNTTAFNKKIAFQAELRSAFGLSYTQVNQLTNNWINLYQQTASILYPMQPVNSTFTNIFGVMYWQWANAYVTENQLGVPSIKLLGSDLVVGYYEISYWKSAFFNQVASQENIDAFQFVQLYNNELFDYVNYEHLFLTYDIYSQDPTTDPPTNSLFNLANFQALVKLGLETPNILTDTTITYGIDFDLNDDWYVLTYTLGLDSVQQTYFIWLWLNTAYELTYSRTKVGGDPQVGLISSIGAPAFEETMTIMQLEFPMFTYASQFNISYAANVTNSGQTCDSFYTMLKFQQAQIDALCNDATNTFNFVSDPTNNNDYFKSALALTSVYLYGSNFNTANANYYDLFVQLTGFTAIQITNMVHSPTSMVTYFMTNSIAPPVYQHYTGAGGNICTSSVSGMCSWGNLTYNQWLRNEVLLYPLPGMDENVLHSSYVVTYQGFSILSYPPEAYYYGAISLNSLPSEATIADTYQGMQPNGLFNVKIFQDLWLGISDGGWQSNFNGINTIEYQRFIALNFGLGGLFTQKTPRQMIEGYIDPVLQKIYDTPIYMGGDQTISPFLSIDMSVTHPQNNSISFFTGEGSYELTRTMGLWLGEESVRVQGLEQTTVKTVTEANYNPWANNVPVIGTDGAQFQPDLDSGITLTAFVNDLSRPCVFSYTGENTNFYKSLTMLNYQLESSQMLNSTANPANAIYMINVDGTSNLTTTMRAPMFASKGHFYQISDEVASSVPVIKNPDGSVVTPNSNNDETTLGIEPLSGVTMQFSQNLQTNFDIFNDALFKLNLNNTDNYYAPLVLVNRQSSLTQEQAKQILGGIMKAIVAKWTIFSVTIILGVAALGTGIFLLIKVRKMWKDYPGDPPEGGYLDQRQLQEEDERFKAEKRAGQRHVNPSSNSPSREMTEAMDEEDTYQEVKVL